MRRAGVPGAESSVIMCSAESRMRNPHITVSGAIRVQRAATEPRCRELGDPQVRRTESRRRRTRLVVLKGGHRDAWPSRRGKRQVEKKPRGGSTLTPGE